MSSSTNLEYGAVSGLTCAILAGGFGTRLATVIPDVPKPMARVAGQPFLQYLVCQVRDAGCREIVLCVGYKSEIIERHFGNGQSFGVSIRYSRESSPLGTGGALAQVADEECSNPLLALNGDSYCSVSIGKMLEAHKQRQARASIAVTHVDDTRRYGSVRIDKNGIILGFSEKGQTMGGGLVNAGIYLLGRDVLVGMPRDRMVSIERDVFPSLVGRGLFGFCTEGRFVDIGLPMDYAGAQRFFANGRTE